MEPIITALWEMDLSGAGDISPRRPFEGVISISLS